MVDLEQPETIFSANDRSAPKLELRRRRLELQRLRRRLFAGGDHARHTFLTRTFGTVTTSERALLPKDKTILVYCNTSSFAAQVATALRMDGFENVRLLYVGFNEWKARGGMESHARASKKS